MKLKCPTSITLAMKKLTNRKYLTNSANSYK
jgi:hypothetical protein